MARSLMFLAVVAALVSCGDGDSDLPDGTELDELVTSAPTPAPLGDVSTECYFSEDGVNLGEINSPEGEEAAAEYLDGESEGKSDIFVYNCTGTVNIDVDNSTDTVSGEGG